VKTLIFGVIFLVAGNTAPIEGMEIDQEDVKQQFEAKYQMWREYLSRPEIMVQSRATSHFACPQFRQIVELGLPALPYIVEKIEQNDDRVLWKAFEEIAKVRIRQQYDRGKNRVTFPDFPDVDPRKESVYVRWWYEGRKRTAERFGELYSEWQALTHQGKKGEATERYERIRDLGIDALPLIMEKIKAGDAELIRAVSWLTDGRVPGAATPSECLAWWAANKHKWTLPPVEVAEPVAEPESGSPPGESRTGDSGAE